MKKALALLFHSGYNSLALKTINKIVGLQFHDDEVLAID